VNGTLGVQDPRVLRDKRSGWFQSDSENMLGLLYFVFFAALFFASHREFCEFLGVESTTASMRSAETLL
jgi:hypothetical protein